MEVQIILLTEPINHLTEHLKLHGKAFIPAGLMMTAAARRLPIT
jgi:ribosomal protein S15P/S13E